MLLISDIVNLLYKCIPLMTLRQVLPYISHSKLQQGLPHATRVDKVFKAPVKGNWEKRKTRCFVCRYGISVHTSIVTLATLR